MKVIVFSVIVIEKEASDNNKKFRLDNSRLKFKKKKNYRKRGKMM